MGGMTLGFGLGLSKATYPLEATPLPASLSVNMLLDGSLDIDVDDGLFTIVITTPAMFAGSYQVTTQAFSDGAVNLTVPRISGSANVNSLMKVQPGLWLYDKAFGPPEVSFEWLQDGSVIADATASIYVPSSNIDALSVRETIAQANRPAQSAIAVPVPIN